MTLRWGLAAAGKIAHDFATALETLPEDEHKIVAVSDIDVEQAWKFSILHNIPVVYDDCEKLAQDPNLVINEKHAKELIEFAKSKKRFLMEGVWSRCFPSYHYLQTQIESKALGEVKKITVEHGFLGKHIDRIKLKKYGGGVTFDLGIYGIQLAQFVFKDYPESIKATVILNEDGVDLSIQVELRYSHDRVAFLSATVLENLENSAEIIGTKGLIILRDYWCCPFLIDVDLSTRSWLFPDVKQNFFHTNACGLLYEIKEVRRAILAGQLESEAVSHSESLILARIEDEIRRQINVKFPSDHS